MARRASRKTSTSTIIAVIAGVAICFAAVVFMLGEKQGVVSNAVDFPIEAYLSRGSQLRDNVYKISGRVEERFTSRGVEELITLVVKTKDGAEERLPIIVPQEVKTVNIEREQEYDFTVKVVNRDNAKGLLYAESVTLIR